EGNVDIQGGPNAVIGQWSQFRAKVGSTAVHDNRNTVEAVHLSSNTTSTSDANQLYTGTWKVSVMRGTGGAVAGQITMIDGPNEDANGNGRLDPGEDLDGDGLLDAGGQPFALVIAGPVTGAGASQTWNGTSHALPDSAVRLDKYQYNCSDSLVAQVFDSGAGVTAATVASNTLFRVVNSAGTILDEERGVAFSET